MFPKLLWPKRPSLKNLQSHNTQWITFWVLKIWHWSFLYITLVILLKKVIKHIFGWPLKKFQAVNNICRKYTNMLYLCYLLFVRTFKAIFKPIVSCVCFLFSILYSHLSSYFEAHNYSSILSKTLLLFILTLVFMLWKEKE